METDRGQVRNFPKPCGHVKGWTARGHPGHWGYGWYRIRVRWRLNRASRWRWPGPRMPLLFGSWVILWWIWFRLKRPSWEPRAVALLTLGFMVSTLIGENLLYPFISLPVADLFHTASLVVRLGLLVVLILVVYWGTRLQGVESWLVLPAVILLMIA